MRFVLSKCFSNSSCSLFLESGYESPKRTLIDDCDPKKSLTELLERWRSLSVYRLWRSRRQIDTEELESHCNSLVCQITGSDWFGHYHVWHAGSSLHDVEVKFFNETFRACKFKNHYVVSRFYFSLLELDIHESLSESTWDSVKIDATCASLRVSSISSIKLLHFVIHFPDVERSVLPKILMISKVSLILVIESRCFARDVHNSTWWEISVLKKRDRQWIEFH